MKLEDRMYEDRDTNVVVKLASHPEWHLDKAHALYELAIRATKDEDLLSTVWKLIGTEITISAGQGLPLGKPAAAYLIHTNLPSVERAMVKEISGWTKIQQSDFFLGLYTTDERATVLKHLLRKYGFVPKFQINELGEIVFKD